MDIKQIVLDAVNAFNDGKYWATSGGLNTKISEDTVLRGDKSPLDSMAFIGLMVAVERALLSASGHQVEVFKPEHFLGKAHNPYSTVGTLVTHIEGLLGHNNVSAVKMPKVIFTDLDGTLYDGIAGEGPLQFRTGLINELMRLMRSGVLIVGITKNYESIIRESFGEYFEKFDAMCVVKKYSVRDKADTIRNVCFDLNLGLDSAAFLDDSEHERDRVKTALPQVWIPENHMIISKLKTGVITEEDRNRTEMYKQEYERISSKPHSDVSDDYMMWLASLGMVLTIKENTGKRDTDRSIELIDRTNQFNFGKSRPPCGYLPYVFSLKDKFGDMGIIGTINKTAFEHKGWNFCVSCRVLGRGVEKTISDWAIRNGIEISPPIDNGRNKAAIDFYNGEFRTFKTYPIEVIEA